MLRGLRSGLCEGHVSPSTTTLSDHVFMNLFAQDCSHAGTGLGCFVLMKGDLNATAYKNIRKQFGEEPHVGVTARCLHTIYHIVCVFS